jgi:hypothetical protein
MKHNDDILIDRFLRGELTEDQEKIFQHKLEEQEGFSKKVKEMEEISSGVRESVLQEKKVLLTEFENEIMSQGENSEESEVPNTSPSDFNRGTKMRRLWWLGAVAAMVIGVVMFLPEEEVKGPSTKYAQLFNEEFETLIKHETMRSSDYVDPYTKEQRAAYTLFSAKLFKEAIPKLEKLWKAEKDSLALKYLGYSYLGIGEDNNGEKVLDKLK